MDFYTIFGIICSIGGLIFFALSTLVVRKILKLFPGAKVRKKWLRIQMLIIIFTFGYIFNIIFLLLGATEIIIIMTAIVYIFGGIFVFIVINLAFKTYQTIIESK